MADVFGLPHPLDYQRKMEREARQHYQRVIRETGADPLWWKLMRNPKFRAAVQAENDRIYLEAMDEIAMRRGRELGILQGLEDEYQRRLREPGRQKAAKVPDNLAELLKKLAAERTTGTTYGALAEYRQFEKQFAKARERGDRIVLLGKHSGVELRALFQAIDPTIDVSALEDGRMYGGDLMIIGLARRELQSWIRHLGMWGYNDEAGLITKTVQMKWGETDDPTRTIHQITYAGIQLAGLRDELALPMGHREISIGVLNPLHPWNQLRPQDAEMTLRNAIVTAFAPGQHGDLSVPQGGLYRFVSRIVIRTSNFTYRFIVNGTSIVMTSGVTQPGQHRALLSEARPGKASAGTRTGTLITFADGGALIQVDKGTSGQGRYKLAPGEVSALGVTFQPRPRRVTFTVDRGGKILSIV